MSVGTPGKACHGTRSVPPPAFGYEGGAPPEEGVVTLRPIFCLSSPGSVDVPVRGPYTEGPPPGLRAFLGGVPGATSDWLAVKEIIA
jgi:hypothetical protein